MHHGHGHVYAALTWTWKCVVYIDIQNWHQHEAWTSTWTWTFNVALVVESWVILHEVCFFVYIIVYNCKTKYKSSYRHTNVLSSTNTCSTVAGQFNFLQFSATCQLITKHYNGGWHVAVVPTAAVGHSLKITNYLPSSSILPIVAIIKKIPTTCQPEQLVPYQHAKCCSTVA
jgi:hypothetical protein